MKRWFWRREPAAPHENEERVVIDGAANFVLIAGVVAAVLLSGLWKPNVTFDVAGTPLEAQNLLRDALLVALAGASLALTPSVLRESNAFSWAPIAEVAKLFAGIFLTIIPVLAMLKAGPAGALAGIVALVSDPSTGEPRHAMYFWATGLLSAFLDNAPTYLVFFESAGGDAQALMGPLAETLKAISMAAVYMGALTYIGNAPNLMIQAIAVERGVKMPSFFGYMVWAAVILLPVLALVTFVFLVPA